MISIVIPVKDGGEPMRRCLSAIRSQRVEEEYEILVVDSGSSDGTQELSRSFGARVHEIPPEEFNHGGTRNLGAKLAKGDTVVFTVDDAEPVDEWWLERLTEPLRSENDLAGAYSRQIAYPSAPPQQSFYIDARYGPQERRQRVASASELTLESTLFSNVSSAIRAPLLERFPFPRDIVIAEDRGWSSSVLLAGFELAYVPGSVVRHSHEYSLTGLFKRYFDLGAAAESIFVAAGRGEPGAARGDGARFVRDELEWLWKRGHGARIPYTLASELTRFAGFQLGARNHLVPAALRPRLSRTPTYWNAPARRAPKAGRRSQSG